MLRLNHGKQDKPQTQKGVGHTEKNIMGKFVKLVNAIDYLKVVNKLNDEQIEDFYDADCTAYHKINQIMGIKYSCELLKVEESKVPDLDGHLRESLYLLQNRLIQELKGIHNFNFNEDSIDSIKKSEEVYEEYLVEAKKLHAKKERELKKLGVTDLIDQQHYSICNELNKLNDDFTKSKLELEKKYEQYKYVVEWDYENILGRRKNGLEESERSVVFYLQMKFERQYYTLDCITHKGEPVKELL